MAISFQGGTAISSTSLTIPTHQIGDLIIMFAFRDGSTTLPALPAGWTSITSLTGSTSASRLAYKYAASSGETSGTWTSFTELACHVYRGVATNKAPVNIPNCTANGSTGTTINIPATNLVIFDNKDSWVVAFWGHQTATNTTDVPAGTTMVSRSTVAGAGGMDTNGVCNSFPAVNITANASAGWKSHVVEIFSEKNFSNNYLSVSAGEGMSVSEKIR